MKSCDQCESYFCNPKPGSPCEKCIMNKLGDGFRRANIPTRIRILKHRLKMIFKR